MEEIQNEENKEESAILKAYKELEANSVPKDKYEKDIASLEEKNRIYLKAITEGDKVELPSDDGKTLKESIAELNKFAGTNLEYWQKMTTAIDKMVKEVPEAEITKITGSDGFDDLIKVNEGMKQMISDANGDPDVFRALYKNRVKDDAPKISSEIEKAGGLYSYLSNKK